VDKRPFYNSKKHEQMTTNFNDTKWHTYTSSTETMRTWAKQIESYGDVPDEFQSAFTESTEPFLYTIFLPENRQSKHKEGSKLICLYEDRFALFTFEQGELQTISSTFADVIYLERGKVLLNSWLTIKTLSGTASLPFNTTNNHLFQPIIDSIREGMVQHTANEGDDVPDLPAFDYLDKINFKYMNYGRGSVRDGDKVIDVTYQPEQDIQAINFFGKTVYRRYKTSHLTVLTAQELILIREHQPVRNNFDPTNGGVFIYIPRCKIDGISFVSEQADTLSTMIINLPKYGRLAVGYGVDVDGLKAGMG